MSFLYRHLIQLCFLLVSVLIFSSCDDLDEGLRGKDFTQNRAYDESAIKNGDVIPGEWIVRFRHDTIVTEIQKAEFAEYFLLHYRSELEKRGIDGSHRKLLRDSCDCKYPIERYRIVCSPSDDFPTDGIDIKYEGVDQPSENSYADIKIETDTCREDNNCEWVEGIDQPSEMAEDLAIEGDKLTDYNVAALSRNHKVDPEQQDFDLCEEDAVVFGAMVKKSKKTDFVFAILDSGLDRCLIPDYAVRRRLWRESEADCHPGMTIGWNMIGDNPNIHDNVGHGTFVTEVLDENLPSEIQCEVKYMIVKIFNNCGGNEFDAACGVLYAINHNARIINASWGSYNSSDVLSFAFERAKEADIEVFASTGNKSMSLGPTEVIHVPSDYSQSYDLLRPVSGFGSSGSGLWFETSSLGSNYYLGRINIAAKADFELDFTFLQSGPTGLTSENGTQDLKGTSFATPQITASRVGFLCCEDNEREEWLHLPNPALLSSTSPDDPAVGSATIMIPNTHLTIPLAQDRKGCVISGR